MPNIIRHAPRPERARGDARASRASSAPGHAASEINRSPLREPARGRRRERRRSRPRAM